MFIFSVVVWFSFYLHAVKHCHVFMCFFGFVVPLHCVIALVSRYAVLCLVPVCVYSYIQIQIVSFAKSTASFFQGILDKEHSRHC